jgi:hypothetical protein
MLGKLKFVGGLLNTLVLLRWACGPSGTRATPWPDGGVGTLGGMPRPCMLAFGFVSSNPNHHT